MKQRPPAVEEITEGRQRERGSGRVLLFVRYCFILILYVYSDIPKFSEMDLLPFAMAGQYSLFSKKEKIARLHATPLSCTVSKIKQRSLAL